MLFRPDAALKDQYRHSSVQKKIERKKRKANRKGYTVQKETHGHHTDESNSVTVQRLGLTEFKDGAASVDSISTCETSGGRCDGVLVSWNRTIVGTVSNITPPVTVRDLC